MGKGKAGFEAESDLGIRIRVLFYSLSIARVKVGALLKLGAG